MTFDGNFFGTVGVWSTLGYLTNGLISSRCNNIHFETQSIFIGSFIGLSLALQRENNKSFKVSPISYLFYNYIGPLAILIPLNFVSHRLLRY